MVRCGTGSRPQQQQQQQQHQHVSLVLAGDGDDDGDDHNDRDDNYTGLVQDVLHHHAKAARPPSTSVLVIGGTLEAAIHCRSCEANGMGRQGSSGVDPARDPAKSVPPTGHPTIVELALTSL